MTTPNTTTPLQYWQPGAEERQLRVFISHRYDKDETLYDSVIEALNRQGFSVQDLSLTKDKQKKGPRGGKLPTLAIQAEIAARIYSSDVFIAPSGVAVSWSPWLTWEIQTATVNYGVPAIFVGKPDQKYNAQLVSDMGKVGLASRICDRNAREIVSSISELVTTRPKWAVRTSETDPNLRFRGPTRIALDAVMTQTPYHPRLADYAPPVAVKKRRIFGMFGLGR